MVRKHRVLAADMPAQPQTHSGEAVIAAVCSPLKGTASRRLLKYLTRFIKLTLIYYGCRIGPFHQPILMRQ